MNTFFRSAAVALLVAATAAPARPQDKPLPEPLPMGVPYVYQPGNNYWYAPAIPVYAPVRAAPVTVAAYAPNYSAAPVAAYYVVPVSYPYPFASSGPVFGRYSWDYTGFTHGSDWTPSNWPHYPYSYQYPTLNGRVWMGYGW
jgi:hypothetical protein